MPWTRTGSPVNVLDAMVIATGVPYEPPEAGNGQIAVGYGVLGGWFAWRRAPRSAQLTAGMRRAGKETLPRKLPVALSGSPAAYAAMHWPCHSNGSCQADTRLRGADGGHVRGVELVAADREWVDAHHSGVAFLLRVDPHEGLTERDLATLERRSPQRRRRAETAPRRSIPLRSCREQGAHGDHPAIASQGARPDPLGYGMFDSGRRTHMPLPDRDYCVRSIRLPPKPLRRF